MILAVRRVCVSALDGRGTLGPRTPRTPGAVRALSSLVLPGAGWARLDLARGRWAISEFVISYSGLKHKGNERETREDLFYGDAHHTLVLLSHYDLAVQGLVADSLGLE